MNAKVAAIIVTYNRKILLKECIEALLAQTYTNMDICIIDNGSTDGTLDYIKSLLTYKNIYYLNTHKNLGGAGGFYYGIKTALKKAYDFVWLMDDDTIPNSNALAKLLEAAKKLDTDIGFLSSCVMYEDGSFCRMNAPGIKRNLLTDDDYQLVQQGIIRLLYASFVSLLIPVNVIKDLGLPIKEFFIWKDDYEYTTRISDKYPCYYVSESIVQHKIKNNMMPDIATDNQDRLDRYVYEYRNGYYLIRGKGLVSYLRYYYNVFVTLCRICKSKETNKIKRVKIMLTGIVKGWFFNPMIKFIE